MEEKPKPLVLRLDAETEGVALIELLETQAISNARKTFIVVLPQLLNARIVHQATPREFTERNGLGGWLALSPVQEDEVSCLRPSYGGHLPQRGHLTRCGLDSPVRLRIRAWHDRWRCNHRVILYVFQGAHRA
ncbi:hypothetical protein [Rubidibacter lacunae]|uniref:hypothetical protein n=1 Tax=Rubidibacter lacunae TaxID=582514 RepID=UPI00041855FC|nr:hypothetical protein [Rubidibacter lacunae]